MLHLERVAAALAREARLLLLVHHDHRDDLGRRSKAGEERSERVRPLVEVRQRRAAGDGLVGVLENGLPLVFRRSELIPPSKERALGHSEMREVREQAE